MIFQSFSFLFVFLPLVLAFYYLSSSTSLRNTILIIASFVFYAWGNILWAALLMLASVIDFAIAQRIHRLNLSLEKLEEVGDLNSHVRLNKTRRIFLILSIVFKLILLGFFKYWDWFIDLIDVGIFKKNGWIFFDVTIFKHQIPLPPAISFYTFETLSYTIDIYRRKFKPTQKFSDYLTFVAFFPKLVAGPIMRAHELLPQIVRTGIKRVSSRNLEFALFLIFWGLFKKLVFADNLGHLVDRCRENAAMPGVGLLLALAFAYQIYCDFSAYCDIARGTAKLFGITLKRNFLTPYLSSNPVEFFQRWNITLSTWIRDYVYFPLGGSRRNVARNIFNLFLTMILVGLWHGAGIFFVIYGIYFSCVMMLYRIFPIDKFCLKYLGNSLGTFFAILITATFIPFGMIAFWVKSTQDFFVISGSFFQTIGFITGSIQPSQIFLELSYGLALFALPIFVTDLIGYKRNREFTETYPAFSVLVKVILYIVMFYLTLFFASRGSYDFIYFRF